MPDGKMDESAVEHAFAAYLASLSSTAEALRAEASRTLERGARQAAELGWSQRRIARALGRSQPEVKRLLDRSGQPVPEGHAPPAETSTLDLVLRTRRDDILRSAARHGVRHVRLVGSVASGADREDSDVDLLVDVDEGVGMFALGSLEAELSELLGRPVDVVPERSLRPAVRETMRPIPL